MRTHLFHAILLCSCNTYECTSFHRFDVVGIYVVMFLEILHTLLRVLMIFSILIVAFGLAFYILLSDVSFFLFSLFFLLSFRLKKSLFFAGGVPAKFFIFFFFSCILKHKCVSVRMRYKVSPFLPLLSSAPRI